MRLLKCYIAEEVRSEVCKDATISSDFVTVQPHFILREYEPINEQVAEFEVDGV